MVAPYPLSESATLPVSPEVAFDTVLAAPLEDILGERVGLIPAITGCRGQDGAWGTVGQTRVIEMADGGWLSSWWNQAMNCEMPACATSPTCERSSAESSRYHRRCSSIRRDARVARSPALRSTAREVSSLGCCRDRVLTWPA